MTDEQRARRAEIARANGANSKGPVSITGKPQRSPQKRPMTVTSNPANEGLGQD